MAALLRYPQEVQSGDFITLTAHEYRSNGSTGTRGGDGAAKTTIVLYMPNSTPALQNGQRWDSKEFIGPMGEIKRDVSAAVARGASNGLGDGFIGGYGAVEGLKQAATSIRSNGADAIRQGIIDYMGKNFAGTSANQLMAYTKGEIFNPNIELLYDGPGLRAFPLNFSFIPKDAREAATVSQIIANFKIWSTPEDQGNGKYKIPCVWNVKYGGLGGNFMNKFKRAAMSNMTVQYNAGLDMHATFDNGYPIRTDIQMNFKEVEVITRKDHEQNMLGGGF